MRLGHIFAIIMISTATSAGTQTVTTDPANRSVSPDMHALPMHIGGRVQATPLPRPMPKGAIAYRHGWPGVYFEGAFVGDRVILKFDDAFHEYRLLIDDAAPIAVIKPGKSELTISGLSAKTHHVRLEKVSESAFGPGIFAGFYVPKDERPLPVRPRRREIEFIGPSGMTGFGNRSPKRECTFEEEVRTTDTQQDYAALVAKHFDADYQINAGSGHGLIRNVKEVQKDPGLIALYPFVLPEPGIPYFDPKWQPQIIEIQGLADIIIGDPEPGEKWTTIDALWDDWIRAYRGFVADLHHRSPHAALLIDFPDEASTPPAVRANFAAAKQQLMEEAQIDGVRMILFVWPTPLIGRLEQTGCGSHPTVKDHRLIADWLINVIDAHPHIWDGK